MDPPQDDDHHQHNNSSPASFKQKLIKSSLFCVPKNPHHQVHHRGETVTSTVDKKPRLVRSNSLRTKSRPEGYSVDHHDINELKHRCKNFISRMGSGPKHDRRHSADFKYDAFSYALNFEEEDPRSEDFPYRDFSARLPRTPPSTDVYNIESIDHQGRTACS
ncbi:uncharacterized protein LOC122297055 [Carya illinoinensis]|uniref:Uncharacterized protein n=1 Tax=Carya illinoinensis TaxID=32201 RepID=A0A8T1NE77_CARIL|nr:uncharacterized protein LOC122297055 [Carya illinoinensis]KAG6628162.1 hypothetical protein CIPAW_15G182500 [Carya illinoinensis]